MVKILETEVGRIGFGLMGKPPTLYLPHFVRIRANQIHQVLHGDRILRPLLKRLQL